MAKNNVVVEKRSFIGFNWQTALFAAGVAILAPYVIRRVLPLIDGRVAGADTDDLALAGKDSVRDVADDLGVGGVSGTINRAIGRVTDRLSH